jgi:MFS family permease
MKIEPHLLTAQKRITAAMFVSQSLFSAAIIAAFTLMPIIAADLSGSARTAGYPSTLTLIGRAAAAYPIGWLMDRWGRRLGLTLGYGFSVFGSIIAVAAIVMGSFWGFCLGALFVGFGRSSSEQGRYIAAEVYPLERRAKVIGMIVFAGTIGAVGGPLLVDPSSGFAERFGFPAPSGPFFDFSCFVFAGFVDCVFIFASRSVGNWANHCQFR